MPVTTPVEDATETLADVLLQVPPGVALLREVVVPTQVLNVPVIAAGTGFTVTSEVV
jgi:hypothetical protein